MNTPGKLHGPSGADLASAYSWVSIYPEILDVFDLAFRQYHQNTINERESQAQPCGTKEGTGQSGRL
jgi:hypothetical protein